MKALLVDLQVISWVVVAGQDLAPLSDKLARKQGPTLLGNKALDQVHMAQTVVLALALVVHLLT